MSQRIISVVAALIRDPTAAFFCPQTRDRAFMQPGGKRDAGESDVAALSREIAEELGRRVRDTSAQALGVFDCPAANEPGFQVYAAVYAVDVEGPIRPAGEIEQIVWIDPLALPDMPFAPLTRDHVLPLARSLQ